mgnify:CR=1 FL=1
MKWCFYVFTAFFTVFFLNASVLNWSVCLLQYPQFVTFFTFFDTPYVPSTSTGGVGISLL